MYISFTNNKSGLDYNMCEQDVNGGKREKQKKKK